MTSPTIPPSIIFVIRLYKNGSRTAIAALEAIHCLLIFYHTLLKMSYARIFQKQAREYHTLLLATGPIDLVVSYEEAYIIANGSNALASITGTGCMNNVLAGACLAGVHGISSQATNNTLAAILSCLLLGIAGENIQDIYLNQGPGSFHYSLMDSISKLTPQTIAQQCNITKLI